jgi:hypothetical protein
VTLDSPSRHRRRAARSAVASGLVVVAVYAALAAWSGALSPLGRGPLLDGLGPTNYRWVSPPPELEATNQKPSEGRFDLPLDRQGVGTQVAFTADSQVTVVVDEASIGPAPRQRSVGLQIDPGDPSELPPPGGELAFFGNAYELTARYRPSGDPIERFDRPLTVVLVYPATSTLHANAHEMLYSADGESWTPLETTDSPGQQQAEAEVPGAGFVIVAGVPSAPTPSAAGATGGGTPPLAIALLVGAGVVLLVGIGLLIRGRAG